MSHPLKCPCPHQVWRIENLELAEVNPSTYGQFYGGDCYLVLYTYQISGQQQYLLYMWQVGIITNTLTLSFRIKIWVRSKHRFDVLHQGRHATQDEITACAYQAVNVDNKYNGAPVQVRVVMGKEPRHFLAIFKGKLILFEVGVYMIRIMNHQTKITIKRMLQTIYIWVFACILFYVCVATGRHRAAGCGKPWRRCQTVPGKRN